MALGNNKKCCENCDYYEVDLNITPCFDCYLYNCYWNTIYSRDRTKIIYRGKLPLTQLEAEEYYEDKN